MKKRISDLMDHIQKADIDVNQETPLSSQRIKELTMSNITNNRKPKRTGFRVLVAAAVIAAMAVTAFAAGNFGWFRQYFEKQNDVPLTSEQIQFIEENEQVIEEAQLQNNCTVELKSFITDGQIALMTIHVTAPEGMNITDAQIGNWAGHGEHYIFQPIGETWSSNGVGIWPPMDDGDGKDNTVDILCELTGLIEGRERECSFMPGTTWKVLLEDVTVMCEDTEYLSQFEVDENGGVDLTWEQSQLAYPTYTLVEGVWEYEFTINKGDFRTIELLEEPIPLTVEYKGRTTDHTITSMVLRSMTLTVFADPFVNAFPSGSCTVVLNDGTEIALDDHGRQGIPSEDWHYTPFLAESPIPLDEVDYVMLCGTKIMIP